LDIYKEEFLNSNLQEGDKRLSGPSKSKVSTEQKTPMGFNDQLEEEKLFLTSKLVMLGESGVGKSSILSKFAYGNFSQGCLPTISPHFVCKV